METKLPITIEPDRTKLHNILSEYELKKLIIDELLNESLEKFDNQLKPNIENYSKLKDLLDIINKDYLEYTM